jgi:hypothetical protein
MQASSVLVVKTKQSVYSAFLADHIKRELIDQDTASDVWAHTAHCPKANQNYSPTMAGARKSTKRSLRISRRHAARATAASPKCV